MGKGQWEVLSLAKHELADSDVAQRLKKAGTHYWEVDVSQNHLTARGLDQVVKFGIRCPELRVLKAFKNQIGDDGARQIARLIASCACLEEIHLSHNQLTAKGVRIIVAAASWRDQQLSPLWLRLEQNLVTEPVALLHELARAFSVCGRDEWRCNSRHCAWKRRIHVPFLHMQRETWTGWQSKKVEKLFRRYEDYEDWNWSEPVKPKILKFEDWNADPEAWSVATDTKTHKKEQKKEQKEDSIEWDTAKTDLKTVPKDMSGGPRKETEPQKSKDVKKESKKERVKAAVQAAVAAAPPVFRRDSEPGEVFGWNASDPVEPAWDGAMLQYMLVQSWKLGELLQGKEQTVPEDAAQAEACMKALDQIVEDLEPERQWKTHAFGSMTTGFGLRGCDLDIMLLRVPNSPREETDGKEILMKLRDILLEKPEFKVKEVILSARVPILKLEYQTRDVDISVNNFKALANSFLLAAYAQLDPMIPEFGTAVKLWAKANQICGAPVGNLSSYAFILMAIYFLQVASGDEVPCLQKGLENEDLETALKERLGQDDVKSWRPSGAQKSRGLWNHLAAFFAFYSNSYGPTNRYEPFRWGEEVVSVRLGRRSRALTVDSEEFGALSRRQKGALHIEDPVDRSRNLRDVFRPGREEMLRQELKQSHAVFVFQAQTGMIPVPEVIPEIPGQLIQQSRGRRFRI
ncbi:unnamed protein product [Effrenium voratum]|nr:unnamed protein product [Effrenium voratum]